MAQYDVSKDCWIPSHGRTVYPCETVELPKDVAEALMHNEPGLLKPASMTTQGRPSAVRSAGKKQSSRAR